MQRYDSEERLTKKLSDMLDAEQKRFSRFSSEMKELPDGNLIVKRSGDKYYMYQRKGNKERGITKDRELCAALARKYVVKNETVTCMRNCSVLKEALKTVKRTGRRKKSRRAATDERIDSIFPRTDRCYTREMLIWARSSYKRSGFMPET